MSKKLTYNILAGKYKGKKLELPSLETTRSTKTIIRESFFNVLQNDIIGVDFFEVFGGSGSMGLEALSRGANKSYFIEKDRSAFSYLVSNCKKVDFDACVIKNGDSFKLFEELSKNLTNKTIFYFDPPFHIREGMDEVYEKTLSLISSISKDIAFLVVIEHISTLKMPENIGNFECFKSKKFGKTTLSYYR